MATKLYTIDIGNTHFSICQYLPEHQAVRPIRLNEINRQELFDVIYSQVAPIKNQELKYLLEMARNKVDIEKIKDFFPWRSQYDLSRIGADRWCQIIFYQQQIAKGLLEGPIWIIDSGTFLTADYLSEKKHLGGIIFPGTHSLAQSFQQGHLLTPEFTIDESPNELGLGHSSNEAMELGIHWGHKALAEVLEQQNPAKSIILTGGKSNYLYGLFKKSLKSKSLIRPLSIHQSLTYCYQQHLPLLGEQVLQ